MGCLFDLSVRSIDCWFLLHILFASESGVLRERTGGLAFFGIGSEKRTKIGAEGRKEVRKVRFLSRFTVFFTKKKRRLRAT